MRSDGVGIKKQTKSNSNLFNFFSKYMALKEYRRIIKIENFIKESLCSYLMESKASIIYDEFQYKKYALISVHTVESIFANPVKDNDLLYLNKYDVTQIEINYELSMLYLDSDLEKLVAMLLHRILSTSQSTKRDNLVDGVIDSHPLIFERVNNYALKYPLMLDGEYQSHFKTLLDKFTINYATNQRGEL